MNNKNYSEGLREWNVLLGPDRVITDRDAISPLENNEIASTRRITAILRPASVDEIPKIVQIAVKHDIPLYPVSTGCNWGYGATSPVVNDCVILDLSELDQILSFDEELGIVTVQPGVTPSQLRDYLNDRNAQYLVPVSGAGPHCSLVGNSIERGYGITPYVDHFAAVTSLEAVLPDGTTYKSPLEESGGSMINKVFKWGIGPYFDGIFSQSNFGIVTQMTIALAPIPEKIVAFIFTLKSDNDLEEAVIAIRETLKSIGNITGSINLMNGHRMLSMVDHYPFGEVQKESIMPPYVVDRLLKKNYLGPWTIAGIMYGNSNIVKSASSVLKKKFGPIADKKLFFSRHRINLLKSILRLLPNQIVRNIKKQLDNLDDTFNVAEGAPTETALKLCYWKSGAPPPKGQMMNPSRDGCGVIWYSPLIPAKPKLVRSYVDMVHRVCANHCIEPLITLTSMTHKCFDSTVPILFDPKNADEISRAKQCYLELYEEGRKKGFLPYRVGIDHMDLIIENGSTYWNLVKKLKQLIDPSDIIAPGRYCMSYRFKHSSDSSFDNNL